MIRLTRPTLARLPKPSRMPYSSASANPKSPDAAEVQSHDLQRKPAPLPVPPLEHTLQLYLQTIAPYATPSALSQQRKLVEDFASTQGPLLQKRLEARAASCRNWLSEWWDNNAYLRDVEPLAPYVSYFYTHAALPNSHNALKQDPLLLATAFIDIISGFRETLRDGKLPTERARDGTPFCMDGFRHMFNTCRVPHPTDPNADSTAALDLHDPQGHHIIIAFRGGFYKLNTHDESGQRFHPNVIWQQLYAIVRGTANSPLIGKLSATTRDKSRRAFTLLSQDPESASSLDSIIKSAFVICLDLDSHPITTHEKSKQVWLANGDATNRLYQKPLQFIITGNGASGCINEHSRMDGTPTLFINEYLQRKLRSLDATQYKNTVFTTQDTSLDSPLPLPFLQTPELTSLIQQAHTEYAVNCSELKFNVWQYHGFGKSSVKKWGFSPDSFLQQMIQLAIYRLLHRQFPTYEAASTRRFDLGRTEATRSVSVQNALLCRDWNNPQIPVATQLSHLQSAIKTHSAYSKIAASGMAIDRHFLGLQNLIPPDEKPHALFNDPLFKFSKTWYISTSQLSSEFLDGYGWAPVNDNGLGLAYMINNDWFHINISTKLAKSGINPDHLATCLTQVFNEAKQRLNDLKAKL
ncbi:hypothetical protein TBLA_0A06860 [Henningerozyma blattae CBS 6284]|uniref:Choline/carnitine acyltransferase domain-containing protein n=1 Tax=Henningerozyma blattae (strain ATCC 34711 / CBS 6284 / DSM 70876 / NBRC 10599 / NRRL Y-10934 / UCD 77-7) TaxID=1071380 RepID=I2GWH6_HENB6|nr:hypothetical protein TBLA_0A06860 [Tetrapisispora blattae CBS 6284]CCH58478.1 hypothetical protein TBLA_0A06860 [Tetrapisispora blattae CBS 6284]